MTHWLSRIHTRKLILELSLAATAGIVSLVGFFKISGTTPADLTSIWGLQDAIGEYAGAKSVRALGIGDLNPLLGYPWGQDWSHFPALDFLNRFELFVLGIWFEPVVAVNVLTVLGFFLIPVLAYAVLRNLRVSRLFSSLAAISISLLPYHFDFEHPMLNNYWAIPVGLFWLSTLMNSDGFLNSYPRALRWLSLLAALIVGLQNSYYAIFFLILGILGLAFCARTPLRGLSLRFRSVVFATAVSSFLAYQVVVRLLREIPAISGSATRSVEESFTWGGKFSSLFNISGDSLLAQNPVNRKLADGLVTSNWTGLIAGYNAAVVAASIVSALFILWLLFGRGQASIAESNSVSRARSWVALWLVGVALFTTSGLGVVFAALVTPQLRVWQRISVVVAMLSLTVAAILASSLARKLRNGGTIQRRFLHPALIGGVVLLALDPLTGSIPYPVDSRTPTALREFVSVGEEKLNPDCPILTIPTQAFPEVTPRGTMNAYDQLLPYLYSDSWRYSYGAISGQLGSRWFNRLSVNPSALAEEAKSLGFCAILVDVNGLDANSPSLTQYQDALGEPVAAALNRWYLFNLGVPPGKSPTNDMFLIPEIEYSRGWTDGEVNAQGGISRWMDSSWSVMEVWNPANDSRKLNMTLPLTVAACQSNRNLEIYVNSKLHRTLDLSPEELLTVDIPLDLPARGRSEVALHVEGAPCGAEPISGDQGVQVEAGNFSPIG